MTPNRLIPITFRCLISALLALWVFSPNAKAQNAATAINGVYNGTYTCAAGPRTVKLSLLASGNGSLTGLFTFYLPPSSHTQAFRINSRGFQQEMQEAVRSDSALAPVLASMFQR